VSLTGSTVSSGNVYAGGTAGFVFGSSTSEGEYIYRNGNDIRVFAGGADRLTVDGDAGNVGIGVTDPDSKLEIKGSGTGSGTALRVRNSSDNELLTVGDNGIVTVPKNYFYVSSGGGAYVQNALRVRGSLLNDQGTLSITGDVSFDSYTLFVDSAYDRVGVGSSSPSYKLEVNGGILAGGKVTYHKSAGSLTTTGYAVAGLTSSPNGNGASAGFTFTCFGHTGSYQKIVYSCYNSTGTWYTQKVIDEGTNDFDVTASANGSTITFTFKSRSGTKSYTPRVSVEAFGSSINNTYA
jgi:adhesin HecA-like repeat protein